MKIAVIDHILNPGGGTRVARSLLPAMKKLRPDLEITFFANEHGMRRDSLREVLEQHAIQISPLRSVKFSGRDIWGLRGSRHVISLMQRKLSRISALLPLAISGELQKELEQAVVGFDFAFFTWPFHLKCPNLACPMAGSSTISILNIISPATQCTLRWRIFSIPICPSGLKKPRRSFRRNL